MKYRILYLWGLIILNFISCLFLFGFPENFIHSYENKNSSKKVFHQTFEFFSRIESIISYNSLGIEVRNKFKNLISKKIFQKKKIIKQDNKVSILIIGASSVQLNFGYELVKFLNQYKRVDVTRFGIKSTGLAWPERYDWLGKSNEWLGKHDYVIIQFGGNDCVRLRKSDGTFAYFKTLDWQIEYDRRLDQLIHLIQTSGAKPILMTMPSMKNTIFNQKIKFINLRYLSYCNLNNINCIDIYPETVDKNGKFLSHIQGGRQGILLRHQDGIHLNRLGSRYLIARLKDKIEKVLNLF